jgi:cyclopropane fatty-acyl-phospholipid synthase-like methyltransferase
MNVCFDLDETITAEPRFFSLLSHAVRKSGGNVYVVTSRTRTIETLKATRQELKELGIVYTHLFILHDRSEAERICPFNNLDWYEKYIFQKTVYCKANHVDIYFDDEGKVIDLFRRFLPEIQVFRVYKKGAI